MFEVEVKEILKSTIKGKKGYLFIVAIILNDSSIEQGDVLCLKGDSTQKIKVKSIEMINYGTGQEKMNHFGILTELSEEQAKFFKGKCLYKLGEFIN